MSLTKIGDIDVVHSSEKYVFKWEIPNFSATSSMEIGNVMVSKAFCFTCGCKKYNCKLGLYPMGITKDNEGYCSVYLKYFGGIKIAVEFRLMIQNSDFQINTRSNISTPSVFIDECYYGCPKFLKRSDATDKTQGILKHDKLTILCEIHVSTSNDILKHIKHELDDSYKLIIFNDYEKLLDKEEFSDIKFSIGVETLYAHKNILSARSPVFAAMFEHNMKENTENEVKIIDFDYEVFFEMIRFIYAGKIISINRFPKDLMIAADKYGLGKLKELCEEYLCLDLSLKNVFECYTDADHLGADKLMKRVKEFLLKNAKEIVKMPDFDMINDLKKDLLPQFVRALVLSEDTLVLEDEFQDPLFIDF